MRENSRRNAQRSTRPADRAGTGNRAGQGRAYQGGSRPASTAADVSRLTGLLEPVLKAMEFDLEAVRVTRVGRRRILRVVVDGDGGVSLDDIADISREVSARLDAHDAMGDEPYTLEVTSPGIDRPLTKPVHWRRAAGRLVRVAIRPANGAAAAGGGSADEAASQLQARVVRANDTGVTLDVDGAVSAFRYEELGPGRVQVEFGRLDESGDADLESVDDPAAEEEPDGH